ncbi:MAG: MBL fold metallo-hydrolase [Pseudomonadota bacterium]
MDEPRIEVLEDGLRRLVAPNPGPMTFRGTNTYLVGWHELAVIDPGPDSAAHMEAILAACGDGARITHILVTHSHLDHSPLARPLARETGAKIHAFGPHDAGRRTVMKDLARTGLAGGGEGIDADFRPDERLEDGGLITGDGWQISALHTPGHLSNHMSFAWRGALFSGDHIMGWSTSLVSPPDGDLRAFMRSCDRIAARTDRIAYPGHGDPVADPAGRARDLISHRKARETQILAALTRGQTTLEGLTRTVYTDLDPRLLGAATRNVLAHLIDLWEGGTVTATPTLGASARFALA